MRRIFLFGVLALLLALPMSATAQETYCSTLNRADCALYYRTGQSLPESVSFKMISEFDIGFGFEALTFRLNATGSYLYDADVLAPYDYFFNNPDEVALEDLSLAEFTDLIEALITSTDADLQLSLEVPSEISQSDFISPLEIGLWYVDGVGYINLTPLGLALSDPTLAGTYGFDLMDALNFGFNLFDEDDWQMLMTEDELADQTLQTASTPLKEQLTVYEATTIQRQPDNNSLAVFQTQVELLPLLALPSFRDDIFDSQTTTTLSRDDVDAFADALAQSMVTDGLFIEETINPDTGYTTRIDLRMDVTIDSDTFTETYSQQTGDYTTFGTGFGSFDVAFTITIDRFQFEQVGPISPPSDADRISLFELFALMGEL
jgi:hypothetical protein